MQWPELYFARHGQTEWNRERRYQGKQDIPLNETGRKQADANGPLLKFLFEESNIDPNSFSWYASPLSRARETMERMRAAFDQELPPVQYDDRLQEISFGHLEGKLHDELPAELAIAPGKRPPEYWNFRPDQGENYQDVADRLLAFGAELTKPSVIVAHGGILRVVRHLVENFPRGEAINWPPPQGTIAQFTDGRMVMHKSSFNDMGQQA